MVSPYSVIKIQLNLFISGRNLQKLIIYVQEEKYLEFINDNDLKQSCKGIKNNYLFQSVEILHRFL